MRQSINTFNLTFHGRDIPVGEEKLRSELFAYTASTMKNEKEIAAVIPANLLFSRLKQQCRTYRMTIFLTC